MRLARAGALGVALALGASGPAWAQQRPPEMRRVRFDVSASREVPNDRVEGVLGVTAEDTDPARLAGRVNETMRWALERAKGASGVEVRSGGYTTQPVLDRDRIVRWRANQDLLLEAASVEPLAELIGVLQSRLQVHAVRFTVSDELRRRTEEALVTEALGAFRARAALIRKGLEARDYEIVELTLQAGGPVPLPERYAARAMAAEVALPALEPGTTTLVVGVSAAIELE